jgi:hypothetical protein
MGSKIVFFYLHQKGTLVKANRVSKTYVLQLVKSFQNHPHMTLHDLPFGKKWGVKKLIFSDFGYFKGITGPYVMESSDGACIMIEAVNSNHNICKNSGFTIWLCK